MRSHGLRKKRNFMFSLVQNLASQTCLCVSKCTWGYSPRRSENREAKHEMRKDWVWEEHASGKRIQIQLFQLVLTVVEFSFLVVDKCIKIYSRGWRYASEIKNSDCSPRRHRTHKQLTKVSNGSWETQCHLQASVSTRPNSHIQNNKIESAYIFDSKTIQSSA